jgi:hypothetical protein
MDKEWEAPEYWKRKIRTTEKRKIMRKYVNYSEKIEN